MNRAISVSDFKRLIMDVLESESFITIYKVSSAHSPTVSFSITASSCLTTKNGLQFHVGTGYINLEFSDSSSKDTLIHFQIRESDDNPNGLWLDLGEVRLFFNKNNFLYLLKENDKEKMSSVNNVGIRDREKVIKQAIIDGRKL